ncbi:MAG: hypothetical protein E7159_00300 [Firmicutes bacterium]|jgi:hypothetical protein|nr:hypothetical protein [Bacillota bacterium]
MINKKYKKALAFLITSFAFFAFSTNASAGKIADVSCEVGKEVSIFCPGTITQNSGKNVSHYSRYEGEFGPESSGKYIMCDSEGRSEYTCTDQYGSYQYVIVATKNGGNESLYYENPNQVKNTKRTNDLGLGANPSGGNGSGAGAVSQVNKGTNVFGKAVQLDGGVCQDFTICKQNVYERNKYMVGANVQYKATAGSSCSNSGSEYTAFCLEAQFPGPAEENGDCLDYTARQIDPTSLYQVSLFALYKSTNGARITDPKTYFAYEAAARLLAYEDSKYQTRSNTGSSSFNNHSAPYRGGVGSCGSVAGEQGDAGLVCQLANNALSEARNMMASGAAEGTLGVRMNQLGGFTPVGSSYQSAFSVTVQNVTSADQVGFGNLSFSLNGGGITVSQQGTPVYDAGAKTITFTVLIGGIPGKTEGCTYSDLSVTLSYSNNADLRSAFMLDAASTTKKGNRQKFAVFAPSEGKVTYKLPLSNCNTPTTDACQPYAALFCNESDKNGVITVNEGAPSEGAPTDWKNCIIGKTDSQGNSYDVVNNSEYVQTEGVESEVLDNIKGFTSDGQPIIDAAFCTVSCKEQYQFMLPGYKEQVKQGTYFSFHTDGNPLTHMVVGINAERKCVSGNIENENYNKRAKDLRAQMVDYLNAYVYYYQLYEALTSKDAARLYNTKINNSTIDPLHKDRCDWTEPSQATDIPKWAQNIKYNQGHWVDAFSTSDISFEVTLFKLAHPDTTDGGELIPYKVSAKGNESFKTVIERGRNFEITNTLEPTMGYNFYNSIVSDYNIFDKEIANIDPYKVEIPAEYKYFDREEYERTEWTEGYMDNNGLGPWVEPKPYQVPDCKEQVTQSNRNTTIYVADENKNSHLWILNQENMFDRLGDSQFDKYLETVDVIKEYMETAKEKYVSLVEEMAIQDAAIQECTNYLANFDETTNPYNFDPVITFSYPDQGAYMAMLAPNVLENVNPVAPTPTYEKFFCESAPSDPEGVFSCSGGASEQLEFKYVLKIDLGMPPQESQEKDSIANKLQGEYDPNGSLNTVAYYNAGSVGSKAFYGRTNGFEWYQSATQFYTIAPDGIVTTNKGAQNATILDTDGRVYPVAINTPEGTYPFYVTFSNIGQFNETGALGRIMGGGNGKAATMSGEAYDQQVCYYQVCRIDDPTCFGQYCVYNGEKISLDACISSGKSYEDCSKEYCPATNACIDITRSEVCNKGDISKSYNFSDAKFHACLVALKEANCCNEFQAYISARQDGLYSGSVPEDLTSWYGKECDSKELCESFTIISQETYFASSSLLTDNSFINNNGALQLNARTVSNYNVFPNGATGINWQTPEAQSVIQHIESMGDGIFAGEPDYKITLNNQCANAIRDYNARQAGNGSGYSNGGFNDFTNNVNSNTEVLNDLGPLDEKTFNSVVTMSEEFKQLLIKNCGYQGKDEPDKINDGSRVLS